MTDTENTEALAVSETTNPDTNQESKENEQAANDANDNLLAVIDAEIEAEKNGEPIAKVTAPVVEEEEVAQEEAEEVAEVAEKPKGRQTAQERIKDLTDSKKDSDARADALEEEMAELKSMLRDQLAEPAEEAAVDDFAPIDEEAYNKTDGKINKLEQKIMTNEFMGAIQSARNKYGEKETAIVYDTVVGDLANEILRSGEVTTAKKANEIAQQRVAGQMLQVHQRGRDVGKYMMDRGTAIAKSLGHETKKPTKTSEKGLDMVELENTRKEAGAPTNKVAASQAENGNLMDQLTAEIMAEQTQQSGTTW